jgi:Na+/H+ antiporter NhaC
MEFITFLIYMLLKRSLLLLLLLAGIGFAIARWKRHPRVSLMTTLGLAFYLIETLLFATLYHWLPVFFFNMKMSVEAADIAEIVLRLADDLLYAAVLILLVAAAFTGREPQSFTINQRTDY